MPDSFRSPCILRDVCGLRPLAARGICKCTHSCIVLFTFAHACLVAGVGVGPAKSGYVAHAIASTITSNLTFLDHDSVLAVPPLAQRTTTTTLTTVDDDDDDHTRPKPRRRTLMRQEAAQERGLLQRRVYQEPFENEGERCWDDCFEASGYCAFCGSEGACCRKGKKDVPECTDDRVLKYYSNFARMKHTCVHPIPTKAPTSPPTQDPTQPPTDPPDASGGAKANAAQAAGVPDDIASAPIGAGDDEDVGGPSDAPETKKRAASAGISSVVAPAVILVVVIVAGFAMRPRTEVDSDAEEPVRAVNR